MVGGHPQGSPCWGCGTLLPEGDTVRESRVCFILFLLFYFQFFIFFFSTRRPRGRPEARSEASAARLPPRGSPPPLPPPLSKMAPPLPSLPFFTPPSAT